MNGLDILICLVLWNHGLDYDFPETVGNFILPTNEITPSFFRGVGSTTPPIRNIVGGLPPKISRS